MKLHPKTLHAPEISPAWLNSPPLSLRQLLGRVVLIDFWDFSSVNCIRTLPYLREWHNRYEPLGLTLIGIHSPRFEFGRVPEVVEKGIAEFELPYPIMLDDHLVVWKTFANKYWPSKFIIDGEGFIRFYHSGEGAYTSTELAIQELLQERDSAVTLPEPMELLRPLDAPGALAFCQPPSADLLFGQKRSENQGHASATGADPAAEMPELRGQWRSLPDCVESTGPAQIALHFAGAEANAVLSPTLASGVTQAHIQWNGSPIPSELRGADIELSSDGKTMVKIIRPRMFSLIRSPQYQEGLLELSLEAPGVQVFEFSFGTCREQSHEAE